MNMKKIFITVVIILFTSTVISYTGIFKEPTVENSSNNSGADYESVVSNSEETSAEDYGGFFRSSTADNPGGRPGNGGGIGQEAPLGGGLPVVVSCCFVLALVKSFKGKRKK